MMSGERNFSISVPALIASRSLGEQVQAAYGELGLDSALPPAAVARTGQTLLLPTRAAGLAWFGSPDGR